jgi:hypothetical protein
MKHYLHSNDPLFDPVTLGNVLHRGAIRDRNRRLHRQGIRSLVQRIRTGKVAINDPATGKERDEGELKRLANELLTLALGQDVQEITEFTAISESEAQELKKIGSAGAYRAGSVFLVR